MPENYVYIEGVDDEIGLNIPIIEKVGDKLILFRKPKTSHFLDNHLEVVLAWWHGKFVVWACRNLQMGGFNAGTYIYPREAGGPRDAFLEALEYYDRTGIPTTLAPSYKERL